MRTMAKWMLAVLVAGQVVLQAASAIPTPASIIGFKPGTDDRLVTYDQSIAYLQKLAAASKYVRLVDAGRTSQGRTMYFALISHPKNLAKLDRYREIAQRLAHPQGLTDAQARELAPRARRSCTWTAAATPRKWPAPR